MKSKKAFCVVRQSHQRLLAAAMIGSVTTTLAMAALPLSALAAQPSFSVPSGPLSPALAEFGRQSGLQVTYRPELAQGKLTPGVSGNTEPTVALSRLLQGSGLSWHYTDAHTVTLSAAPGVDSASASVPGASDSLLLDTITVTASPASNPVEAPYQTAAPTSYISADNIEHFRGSSPADIFRGTPGVMSGESRNGAGSIDVNIRGMQGMGRVKTTVDGAENALQVYQGYQGISNRTFVDPDLLAGVDITKGSDVASSGIAGTVNMRTLNPGDIIKDGNNFGFRLKGGYGSNSASPHAGDMAGYSIQNYPGTSAPPPQATAPDKSMDRPNVLKPTQGSVSIVAAVRDERFELLGGYAYRRRGNYYAGNHGPAANVVNTGPRPYCYSNGTCLPSLAYSDYIENKGLTNYRAGEEVLNTQLETKSWLTKGIYHFGDGQRIQLGYTNFRSEAGDLLASMLTGNTSQEKQQSQTAGTRLDTGTLGYSWKPSDSDLIDLSSHLWMTELKLRNPPRNAYGTSAASLGLPGDFRTGSDTRMWGADIANKSSWETDYGALRLTYGASWNSEDTRPSAYTEVIEGWLNLRNATRKEAAFYTKAEYQPVDWFIFNSGLRYAHYWSHDRQTNVNSENQINPKPNRGEGGYSPSVGITIKPTDNTQFYVNYSNALRFPSLFESVSAFTIIPNPNIEPERSSNWEVGVNYHQDHLFNRDDKGMVKLSYFNWSVKNYIARSFREFQNADGSTWSGMQVYNIDRAKFSGLEWSSRYEHNGFAAELGANYYLNVAFCQSNSSCEEKSMYGDYATNQVPPEYTVNLTLSQKLFDDKLTVGTRATRTGPRAIGHGQVTSQGLSQFITQVQWKPYTLIDVFADYSINDNLTASLRVENLTDKYYVDPLSLINVPGPGRTFYATLTATF